MNRVLPLRRQMESSSWFVRQLKEKINGEKKMPNCGEEKKNKAESSLLR